jgi:transcriptional regulator with XRE-family HTH domain
MPLDWAKGLKKESDSRIAKAQKSRESNPEWRNHVINNLPKPKLDGKLDEIREMVNSMSQSQIAEKLGVTQGAISDFMKRYNIQARPKYIWTNRDPNKQKEINQKIGKALKGNINWRFSHKFPNKEEEKLIYFFERWNLPFKYVGDGSFKIDGKCPDFIYEERKATIEYFGELWHESNDESKRIDFFKERNWNCLIIWGKEVGWWARTRKNVVYSWERRLYDKILHWLADLP